MRILEREKRWIFLVCFLSSSIPPSHPPSYLPTNCLPLFPPPPNSLGSLQSPSQQGKEEAREELEEEEVNEPVAEDGTERGGVGGGSPANIPPTAPNLGGAPSVVGGAAPGCGVMMGGAPIYSAETVMMMVMMRLLPQSALAAVAMATSAPARAAMAAAAAVEEERRRRRIAAVAAVTAARSADGVEVGSVGAASSPSVVPPLLSSPALQALGMRGHEPEELADGVEAGGVPAGVEGEICDEESGEVGDDSQKSKVGKRPGSRGSKSFLLEEGEMIDDVKTKEGGEEEPLDNMDFEEISDEELEEENRPPVGDALGVDWGELVSETRLKAGSGEAEAAEDDPGSAVGRNYWSGRSILARLGVSYRYAGANFLKELTKNVKKKEVKPENGKTSDEFVDSEKDVVMKESDIKEEVKTEGESEKSGENAMEVDLEGTEQPEKPVTEAPVEEAQVNVKENKDEDESAVNTKEDKENVDEKEGEEDKGLQFLHPVPGVHASLRIRRQRLRNLFSFATHRGQHGMALSARRDLAIRRQLCNLPAKEMCGFIPSNMDNDLYRLSIQLFERTAV